MDAEQIVREVITEHLGESAFDLDSTWDDLEADSLDLVEMLLMIEAKTKKDFDVREMDHIKTVGDLVEFIKGAL